MRAKGSHRFDSSATSLINHVPVTAKSRTDHERLHTADSHTDLLSTHGCAPHPGRGATASPQSVATRECTRDTVRGGAVATGVPHPLTGDGYCLGTVESHRATRRCQTSPGTASRDAVPLQTFVRHSAALQTLVSASRNAAGINTGVPALLWPPLLFRYGYKI